MNLFREGTLQRTVSATIVFAVLAIAVAGLLSWLSYRAVRTALEDAFERQLENVAATIASQVSADDLDDAQLFGEEGTGYGTIYLLVEELRATTRVSNASVLDTAAMSVYDGRGREFEWTVSRLDSLVPGDLRQALRGESTVSGEYRIEGDRLRAAFAPIRAGDVVHGVVAVESEIDYAPALAGFGRTLLLTALLIAGTITVLAVMFVVRTLASARLERRLSRAENLAAMGRLTATLAHEIKNPLAIIRGSAQRLGRLDPEAQRMADYVVEESDRLSRTVARYLQFARGTSEEGVEGASAETGDARRTLEQTLALLEGEFAARKVNVVRQGAWPVSAPVGLDDESLKQVYLNLLLNALEAMQEGGRLEVQVGEDRGQWAIRVADDGKGIEPDVLRRLGSPFYTTKAKGSGLGLFLTRRLVESAGGTLTIESTLAEGTTCLVRLSRVTPR